MTEGTSKKSSSAAARGRSESDPATAENYEYASSSHTRGKRNKRGAVAVGDNLRGAVAVGGIRHGVEHKGTPTQWQPYSQSTHE
ncbi:hypothetical protein JMUB6875_18640 [Nocardia sp. JMUB6875]